MELGGNDPTIICADADLEKALKQLFWEDLARATDQFAAR